MEQPEGFKLPGKENKVWRLRKALYGLKQAGLSWWCTTTKSMLALGFKRCKSDAGVYYYHDKKTKALVIAIVYVDDICKRTAVRGHSEVSQNTLDYSK